MKRRILLSVAVGIVTLVCVATLPIGDWLDYSRGWYRGMQGEEKYVGLPADTSRSEEVGWEAGATVFHRIEQQTAKDMGLETF